jgi:hypothetical protein
MVIGTVAILAYYGLLPPEHRYSRAIIIFSGFAGTVVLLGMHDILYRMGILKYIPYDKLPRKAVIVADDEAYRQTAGILQQVHYAPELSGRISPAGQGNDALSGIDEMKELLYATGINEVIFCINGLTYNEVFEQMQHCGQDYEYKIHIVGSQSFVGSNSSSTSGDLYTIDRRFNLSDFAQVRNKRMVDIGASLLLLLLFPFTFFRVRNPGGFLGNCFQVIMGSRTWVGYAASVNIGHLPHIRKGVLEPFNILPGYEPSDGVKMQINNDYAMHYAPMSDISLLMKNFRYLGGKS